MRSARAGNILLLTTPQILAALALILKNKFDWQDEDVRDAILAIGRHAEIVKPKQKISILADDPDNRILECAAEGGADDIVSGDHHLLRLKRFNGIPILGASELLAKIR
jgi:putative PIN family toxin of toxin-antitoxin system